MNTKAIFSSARQNWKTPEKLYKDLDDEFHFDFDPCPTHPNFDGLTCEWGVSTFLNPPYSQVKLWLQKALVEHDKNKIVVALLPSRTGTSWFHEYVLPHATEIRFIRGRLQFDDCGMNAPFDSLIIIYSPEVSRGYKMKIQNNTVVFRSMPEFYNKESVDLKRNTVRMLTKKEAECIQQNPPQFIKIHQVGMMEERNYFTRTIRDISTYENLTIFSW